VKIAIFALSFIFASQLAHTGEIIYLGDTYVCDFGQYGVATIDTRHPGTSITINGQRYPALSGSYFYQSMDGKIAIAFKPDMKSWTLLSVDEQPTDSNCKKVPNTK
jgi:hypothetical protein